MHSHKFEKDTIRRKLILAIAAGVLLPNIPLRTHGWARDAYRAIEKKAYPSLVKEDAERVRRSLYSLKRGKYIKETEGSRNKKGKIELTKKGRALLCGYEFSRLSVPAQKKWDEVWRVVFFDIPEKHRYARDILRDKLKRMGFFQIQQSTWVYPYECKEELDLVCEYISVQQYVLFCESPIENDRQLRKYFQKKGLKI
jgi:hypothetical protein